MSNGTVGEPLVQVLRQVGVTRVYGVVTAGAPCRCDPTSREIEWINVTRRADDWIRAGGDRGGVERRCRENAGAGAIQLAQHPTRLGPLTSAPPDPARIFPGWPRHRATDDPSEAS